jgi:hypothetical protein
MKFKITYNTIEIKSNKKVKCIRRFIVEADHFEQAIIDAQKMLNRNVIDKMLISIVKA